MGLRTSVLNARNAFAHTETPEEFRRFNMGFRGPLVAGKTSLRLHRRRQPFLRHARHLRAQRRRQHLPRPGAAPVRVDQRHGRHRARAHQQPDAAARVPAHRERRPSNQGVGDFTLPERAFERTSQRGPGPRSRSRAWSARRAARVSRPVQPPGQTATSILVERPAINVIDTFNKGGAGVSNNGSSRTLEVADNFDFNIGRTHAMRVGLLFEGGAIRATTTPATPPAPSRSATSSAYKAGSRCSSRSGSDRCTRRSTQYQLGLYWQDDIRVNRNLSFSLGVRQEMQSLIGDKLNLMPRLGFTWNAPGKVVLRGGYGTFYDWYDTEPLRPDAARERRLAARPADPQSRLSRSVFGASPHHPARRPRAGVAGPVDALHPPGVDWRGTRDDAEPAAAGVVSDAARAQPDAVGQRERARRIRRAAGAEHRHRHAVRVHRPFAERSPQRRASTTACRSAASSWAATTRWAS